VVLVKVVELVVEVDGRLDLVLLDVELQLAGLGVVVEKLFAQFVIGHLDLTDLVAHHVEHDSDGEEDDTEEAEGDHGAHGGGHWSPGRQGLLLELGLFQLLDFVLDPIFLLRRQIHAA